MSSNRNRIGRGLSWLRDAMQLSDQKVPTHLDTEALIPVLDVAQGGLPFSEVNYSLVDLVFGNTLSSLFLPANGQIVADASIEQTVGDPAYSWKLLYLSIPSYIHTVGAGSRLTLSVSTGDTNFTGMVISDTPVAAGSQYFGWKTFSPSLRPLWAPPGYVFRMHGIDVTTDADDEFVMTALMLRVPAKFYPGA